MEGDGASLLSPLTARCEEAGVAERRWHRCMPFFRDRPLRRAWRMGTEVVVLVQRVFLKVFFLRITVDDHKGSRRCRPPKTPAF